jgi:hypothetical protein
LADFPAAPDPFRADLTPPGLAALAAATDLLRQRLFKAMVKRETDVPMTVTVQQLQKVYTEGVGGADARWLVTLFALLMPASAPLPAEFDEQGIGEIARAGLLEPKGGRWEATDLLRRLATWWKVPVPAVAHEVIVLDNGQLRDYRYLIAFRGDGPLWLFEFWQGEGSQAGITMRSRTGGGYRRAITKLLKPLGIAPPARRRPSPQPAATGQQARQPVRRKVVRQRRQAVQPAQAGRQQGPAPVQAPQQAARPAAQTPQAGRKFCTNCGQAVAPEATFCTSCGQKLS